MDERIMIDFKCPNCGEPMSVPTCLAGRTETCPGCGKEVAVPAGPGDVQERLGSQELLDAEVPHGRTPLGAAASGTAGPSTPPNPAR